MLLLLLLLLLPSRDVLARHAGLTLTYGSSGGSWRELCHPQPARALETVREDQEKDQEQKKDQEQTSAGLQVVVEEGVAERLAADCSKFLSAGSWYRQRGVPHRSHSVQLAP